MADEMRTFVAGHVPAAWFAGPPDVTADSEEILIVGRLPDVDLAAGTSDDARAAARQARIKRFREDTRDERIRVARDIERQFRRKVAWGARCGDEALIFTTLSIPVMTRLRINERAILDTLVAGGVARSRSEALAWCVRLVGMHQEDWIKALRDALVKVDEIRSKGPLG